VIRIAIVDDHHIVREGLGRLLAAELEFEIVAQGSDGTDVAAIVEHANPDVLVLDMSMPGMSGIEVLEALALLSNGPAVVVLSMQDDMALVEQSLALGARGYVLKQAVSDELVAAVHAAHRGGLYLCSEIATAFRGPSTPVNASLLTQLSPREREVTELIVDGLSTKQIARRFSTSFKTVQKQRQAAMRKFDAPNTASFVRKCIELGINGSSERNDVE
jgi:DNA-binding NarL/FixJ family response regulator